jgi:putative transposase
MQGPDNRSTAHPNGAWVSQQARQIVWQLTAHEPNIRFLIRDNDKKFTAAFDTVFRSEGIDVIPTPVHAPNANACMERWIRSAREECRDKRLIINAAPLRRVMREYAEFFNTARPHQGLDQQIPIPKTSSQGKGQVRCRNVLGGIIHDYYRDAA